MTKDKDYKVQDKVLLAQRKTVVKPPFDPVPFTVEKVGRDQIKIKRGRKELVRNKAQLKLLTPRPERLQVKRRDAAKPIVDTSEDEEDYNLIAIRNRNTGLFVPDMVETQIQEQEDDGAHILEQTLEQIVEIVPQNNVTQGKENETEEVENDAGISEAENDESFLNVDETFGEEEEMITPQIERNTEGKKDESEDSEDENVEHQSNNAKQLRRTRAAAAKKKKRQFIYHYYY